MRIFRRLLIACILSAWSVGWNQAAAAPPAPSDVPPLVVGITGATQTRVAGEEFRTIDRFESELAVALARTQGRRVIFQLGPLDWLLHELAEGRIDFMPGIARTPERQQQFDFSVAHSRLNTCLFVRRSDAHITSADDLRGRRIIVVKDSFSHKWAERRSYPLQVVPVADLTEGLRLLAQGGGDALLAKQINIYAAMRETGIKNIEMRGAPVADLLQDMCIAVRLGNRDLLAQLNEALFALKQTGELDRIYEKWLALLEPSGGPFARLVRYVSIGAALLVVLAGGAWVAYRVQSQRTRRRLAEIERRVAERTEELAAAKARFEEVVANTPAGIVLLDPHDAAVPGRIVECNELACRMHGYAKAELIGASYDRLLLAPFSPTLFAAFTVEGDRRRHGHTRHRCKDGSVLEVEFYSTFVRLDGQELALVVDLDVTDRRRAEEALRRKEEFQRLVLQATNDSIFEWDIAADRFALTGRGWQLLGFEENDRPAGRLGWWQRIHPDDAETAERALHDHLLRDVPFALTARHLHKDGSIRWLYGRANTLRDARGQPVRMVGSYTDITELKRIDEELQLTRRLRAIGELVGGIAHEFNNLLTPILLQTSQLMERKAVSHEIADQLQPVLDAARRAQVLTRQLLQFGRHSGNETVLQPLATVVASTLNLVRSTIDRRIAIVTECDAALGPVRFNATTMGQVVLNLVLNARDALMVKLEAAPAAVDWRPQIVVRLTPHLGPAKPRRGWSPDASPRRWQCLSVQDNGTGISHEICERIFEPFFTTKAVDKGTGLGLAMVWHALEELGGWIEVASTPGESTRFDLYLPEAPGAVAAAPPVTARAAAVAGSTKARQLLLIEDDPLVGRTLGALLSKLGHAVSWVDNGDEAFQRLQPGGVQYDAVFTDLNMPGLGGEELVERVRAIGYRGQVLVVSGYITPGAEQRLRAAGVTALVHKPFEFEQLQKLLADLWAAGG